MTYIQKIRERIQQTFPDINPTLVQYYTLALVMNGGSLLAADVHDAYCVWLDFYRPTDPLIGPYDEHNQPHKAYCESMRNMLNGIAVEFTMRKGSWL